MIALVDCNNFYCSCERVFQPSLEGKPLIVLSNNDGCAISLSDEAKAAGIKMGSPAHMITEELKKNNVTVFSSNYTFYGDMSQRVMSTIQEFVPRMEVYSIDETFVDFSDIPVDQMEQLGFKIKETVKQYTGIPVSIGIAPTKTLAKMANRFAKKTKKHIGVHLMRTSSEIDEVLQYTDIADVWGIGAQHATRLISLGVNKASDFVQLPEEWVRKNMSVVGLRMIKEMKGIPCIKWEFTQPKRKGIRTSRSFGKLMRDKRDIAEAVSNFAANCALKLRNDKTCAKEIEVFIQTNPFRNEDEQFYRSLKMQLPVASNDSSEIIKNALNLLDLIYCEGYNFMKAGVLVADIVPDNEIQQGLFDETNRTRSKKLMCALDNVNNIHGKNAIRVAAQGYEKRWAMRQANLSPCYTTDISKLPIVKCYV